MKPIEHEFTKTMSKKSRLEELDEMWPGINSTPEYSAAYFAERRDARAGRDLAEGLLLFAAISAGILLVATVAGGVVYMLYWLFTVNT